MKLSALGFLGLAVFVTACTVRTPVGVAMLSDNPAVAGGTFTSPGGISVAVDVVEISGKTGVCGVWAESEKQSVLTKGRAKMVLGPAAVLLGNDVLLQGLDFLRQVPPARSYAGTEANCVVTERPWTEGDATRSVKIIIPRQVVYSDFDGLGTMDVIFRPGGPSAHPDDPKPWQTNGGS